MKRINFWSSPRNISTALMYSFAQRTDFVVVDEPLYAHYLVQTKSKAKHPESAKILQTMEQNGELVVQSMLNKSVGQKNLFFKQMTHHLIVLDYTFLGQMENVLLIRDPRLIINSYTKVIHNPTIEDIGIKQQFELMQYLQSIGKLTAIVDAVTLLKNPKNILAQLCERLEIPFQTNMLNWEAGARPEDGIWAKHWYKNVHQSTGFQAYKKQNVQLSQDLEQLAEECKPYYDALLQLAIKKTNL